MPRLGVRAHRAPVLSPPFLLTAFVAACATPERAPLSADAVELAVAERDVTPETLSELIERAGLAPLALVPLPEPGVAPDLDGPAFWRACALAYAPSVRAARRALAAASARAESAGQPGPIQAFAEIDDLGDPGERVRAVGMVDLIGILGLGPAATARALADEETRAAGAQLELAAWDARVEVDRARAELAVALEERRVLAQILLVAAFELRRADLLAEHGRVSEGARAMAGMAVHGLEHRIAELDGMTAAARAQLARAAGLAIGATELDGVTEVALERAEHEAASVEAPERADLFRQNPRLRAALVEYAVAEARLADAAAARWPGLDLGPQLLWEMDELLLGAMVATRVAWPGSLDGMVQAAEVERSAARDVAEDLFLSEEARVHAARVELAAARRRLANHSRPAEVESARLLRATTASFSVDPAMLEQWAQALRMRVDALSGLYRARIEAVRAALELEAASGPRAEVRA